MDTAYTFIPISTSVAEHTSIDTEGVPVDMANGDSSGSGAWGSCVIA